LLTVQKPVAQQFAEGSFVDAIATEGKVRDSIRGDFGPPGFVSTCASVEANNFNPMVSRNKRKSFQISDAATRYLDSYPKMSSISNNISLFQAESLRVAIELINNIKRTSVL
jgi:hypothetical protein